MCNIIFINMAFEIFLHVCLDLEILNPNVEHTFDNLNDKILITHIFSIDNQ